MIYPGMFIFLFGAALIIYLISDSANKIFLVALIVIALSGLVILFSSIDRIIERKKEKKHQDFIRKMEDYDKRTFRY